VKFSIQPTMRRFITILFTVVTFINLPIDILASSNLIEDVLLRAQEEDKHIFVRFSASWCLPCQMLDDQLANHPEIVKDINEIYIGIELDYDEPVDMEWFVRYGVQCLPTMMVIDDMGQVVDRLDGSGSMAGLESFLHLNSKHPTDRLASKDLSNAGVSNSKIHITDKKVKATKKVFVPSDFSIQFGAFSSYENAQKLSNILLTTENISTIILEENANGRTLFKVRQTYFPENKTGAYYVNSYKKKGIDCMLKKV